MYIAALYMAALGISILSPVDLLPGGEIDVRRVPLLGIHNGETLSEFPGLDEMTSARVLGRLLYAVAGASSKPSSRTLETSENTELLRSPSARSSRNGPTEKLPLGLLVGKSACCRPRGHRGDLGA